MLIILLLSTANKLVKLIVKKIN